MAGSNKDLLRKLGVISPMEEIREQMAALTNPSYLTQIQEQMKALTNPSYLSQVREAAAVLANPLHLTQMQEAVAALASPSYLTQVREAAAVLANPLHLTQMREMAALNNPSYLARMQEQAAAFTNPSYLTQVREAAAVLANPSYLAQVREAASTVRMQAELSAVLGSYQELIRESALANYLVTPDDAAAPRFHLLEPDDFDSLEVGDFAELEVGPDSSVDLEIVKAISEGRSDSLSLPAAQRLQFVYLQIVAIWDMFLRIVQTYMAYVFLTTLFAGSSVPADIPVQAALLSNEQRVLLADYRVVNREGARLRAEPTTESKIVASLSFAQPVEVVEYNDKGWYRVEAQTAEGNFEGWMYVSVTSPLPKPKYPRGQNVDPDAD